QFADELEKAGEENFTKALNELIKKTIREHKRILFNGDGYSEVWEEEAKRRGLANLKTTVDALPTFLLEKNIKLFTSHNIYTEKEMRSRYAILLDSYNKIINIEAHTMIDMARKEILPAVSAYVGGLFADLETKLSVAEKLKAPIPHNMEEETAVNLSTLCDEALTDVVLLETLIAKSDFKDDLARGQYYRDSVIPAMNELRKTCDAMEKLTAKEMWPLPQYGDMLFNI
ncbi:MAG: glutamine synthetase type III, partial [Lachnospiraceae bacterium]|nr:glutamine synthetase type III [Lachnospiraceae bacterium]